MSTELSSEDALLVVTALQTLSDEKTKELVFHLGVPTYMLQNIGSRYSVESQSIHAIQTWLDRDTEASWEKIVRGLIEIKMNVLAKQVATQHCPQFLEATSALIKSATVHTTQPIPTPAQEAHAIPYPTAAADTTTDTATDNTLKSAEVNHSSTAAQTSHTTSSLAEARAVALIPSTRTTDSTQSPTVIVWSIEKVKATILELEERFSDLMSEAEDEISAKENQDPKFLKKFRNHLLLLPVAKKALHVKFFKACEDDILAAKTTQKILAIICRHSDYRNYEILLHLITRFCSASLQESMQEYRKMLEGFEMATTVDVYICAIPPEEKSKELEDGFSKMVVKIDKPSSECSLYEIRKLNEAIIEESYLNPHSVYIGSVSPSCVVVEFRFPTSAVGWVLAAMTPQFMTTHLLTEVTVDRNHLTVVKAEMNDLNDRLKNTSAGGHVVRAASLLNSGADIETVGGRYSDTPLNIASTCGSLHVSRLLLQRGAMVDSRNKDGWTPLITAAVHGHRDVVIELLDNGADINAQSNHGWSALMRVAWEGRTEAVTELAKAGADLNLQNNDGDSALMRAASGGHSEVVVELVKAGVNLNLQNNSGDTALMRAAYKGRTKVVVELVKAGADLNLQNYDGDSALMKAASGGRTDVVVELVKAGANLNLQSNRGDSAVMTAILEHRPDVLRELVRGGADLNLQNEEGLTALMVASRSGRHELTDILLTGPHIDVDIQENTTNWSALFFSAERSDVTTTQSLLKAGANPHLRDKNGFTALEVAQASYTKMWDDELGYAYDHEYSIARSRHHDIERVVELLSGYIQEADTLHSHPETSGTAQDSTPALQDSSQVSEDTISDNTDQVIVTPASRRLRRATQAQMNMVNRLGKRIQQIFSNLERRLKSADKKAQSGVRGEGAGDEEGKQKTKAKGGPCDKDTSYTST